MDLNISFAIIERPLTVQWHACLSFDPSTPVEIKEDLDLRNEQCGFILGAEGKH